MPNPLAATPDYASNPLSAGTGPAPSITAAQPPTQAAAYSFNANAAQAWLNHQRTMAVHLGLADPETGLPTKAGLIDAARQYANGVLMGSTAPGAKLVAPTKTGLVDAAGQFGNAVPMGTAAPGSGWAKATSESLADQLRADGYNVSLDHSSNPAGQSSYMRIVDPTTGRFMPEVRVSDHRAGQRTMGNYNLMPTDDPSDLLAAVSDMRRQGPTEMWRQNKALDDAGLGDLVGKKRARAIESLRDKWQTPPPEPEAP